MADGRLIALTGVMAAGKSTVAQVLAERFPKSSRARSRRHVTRPD
jgi:dephospho-CoA kinase